MLPLPMDMMIRCTRLHLAAIESFMLYPLDEPTRRDCLISAEIEYALLNPSEYGYKQQRHLLELSNRTLPLNTLQENAKEWFIKGMIVGNVLHNQIGYHRLNDIEKTKGELIRNATKIFEKKSDGSGFIRVSPKTFNNDIWPKLRSVAHLWAAAYAGGVLNDYPSGAFPCRLDRLSKFLSDAEAYRIMGEEARPRYAGATILDPHETVKFPLWMKVTPSDLTFEPLPIEEKTVPDHSGKDTKRHK